MNAIDKIVAYFSPSAALNRQRARIMSDAIRSYEGATQKNRQKNWRTRSTDQNAEAQSTIKTLRNRSRDLVRNNPWAFRACQVIENNTVGTGILPQAQGPRKKQKQDMWEQWGDTTTCDADGRLDFYGIQGIVMKSVAESGEIFVRRVRVGRSLKIRVLESDYCDESKSEQIKDGVIIQGVEFNRDGERVAYWMYSDHPGSILGRYSVPERVPASEIIHIYRMDRPGQVRGIPWCAPVMIKIRDLADWQDNKLLRAKLAACFTAFVTDADPTAPDNGGDLIESMMPGMIEYLPPGKDIEFATPPSAGGEESYVADQLRDIASTYGITYEALTGNLSGVNFSSGRMGWLEMERNIESWRWRMLIPQLCNTVWQWFNEFVELTSGLPYNSVIWTPPRRQMIDPAKEVRAIKDMIRSGLLSLSEAQRMAGFDPEILLKELSDDYKRLDKLGLQLDIDARIKDTGGQTNAGTDED